MLGLTGCGASSYFLGSAGLRSRLSFLIPLPAGACVLDLSPPLPLPLGGPLNSLFGPGGLPNPFLSGEVAGGGAVTDILALSTLISTLCSLVGLLASVASVAEAAFCCSILFAHTFTAGGGASLGGSLGVSLVSFPPPRGLSRGGASVSLLEVPSSLDLPLSRRLR